MVELFLSILVFLSSMANCHVADPASDTCERFRQTYYETCGGLPDKRVYGSPGKMGPKGSKGDSGATGPQGPVGKVDYDAIRAELKLLVEDEFLQIKTDLKKMETKVENLRRLGEGICPVLYNGKCFRLMTRGTVYEIVTFDGADELCKTINWKLANIYDLYHYNLIADYVSRSLAPNQKRITAWTAITWKNREATLSTGEKINLADFPWYPGYPSSDESYANMGIYVRGDPEHKSQGIYNYPRRSVRLGALCEF